MRTWILLCAFCVSGSEAVELSKYHDYYYLEETTSTKYCSDCEKHGYVLRKKNAECSARDEELAPFKTCTVDECAELCLKQKGCNYFIVGNGIINGVDKTGHCFWEKTTNGCKNKDDKFNHNAYDFYALCREGAHKEAEFQCKTAPGKLKAGQCKERPKPTKGIKQEHSSAKDDADESEYQSYYYLKKTTDKKYCYDCEQDGYVLRKKNAECSARDEELAPFKTCTVEECAQLCLKQKGCNYFIVGNGEINGADKTGHCFWEKTTNGCKNKDDKFNHNAYDFYALCREGEHKEAEYQCKGKPAALKTAQCEERPKPKGNKQERSSAKDDADESEYQSYYYLKKTTDKKYCYDCEQDGYVLRKKNAECTARDEELAPYKTCTVEECAQLCLNQEGCNYFIVGNGKINGADKTGHCFWEKTLYGCKNKDDKFNHNAYDFYALCREGAHKEAEFQCKGKPAALKAGQCKERPKSKKGVRHEHSSHANEDDTSYHDYYYLKDTNDKKYCYDCEQHGYVLRKKNAECSAVDEELAPFQTCTIEECAQLCKKQKGCNYFIVGNGKINGVDKTGHCFWEKTTNGCKNKDDKFNHNAYDFFALCREGVNKEAEFQCKGKPAAIKAGQCEERPKPTKGIKQERSSAKDEKDESEYRNYYYLKKTNDKKYCYDCQQQGYVLRKKNAECSAVDEELAPFKTCTVDECAQLCLKQEGCNYFIVGNGIIDGADKTGHCFWEKTTNGCKNKDDTFNHNAYDFYALCRQNEKDAEYQCNKPPHKLNAGQCMDRPKETGAGVERSSGHEHSPKKKYCFDCTRRGFALRKKDATCSSPKEALASGKTCTLVQCAKLCQQKDGCQYFAFGVGSKKGQCVWQQTTLGCTGGGDKFESGEYNFFAVCNKAKDAAAEFQCPKEPHKITTAGECGGGGQSKKSKKAPIAVNDGSSGSNAGTKDTGTHAGNAKTGKAKTEPEETSGGSVLSTFTGVVLGILVIGGGVIFAIRRYNSAKYDEGSGTSTMGHVYGIGGNANNVDSYKDDEDDDEDATIKFADHPSDGNSAEDED